MQGNQQNDTFTVIGVSYKKTETETRGLYSLCIDSQKKLIHHLQNIGGDNILVISTCNRTEIYCKNLEPDILLGALASISGGPLDTLKEIAFLKKGRSAVKHLFSVGCGLDSQIIGDFEIIGQVKKAFALSMECNSSKAFLDRLVSLVIKASKRIKSETNLSTGATSVSFSGVQYIREHVEDLGSKKILLFGLGKMGRNTCENLVKHSKHNSITLINRSAEKAQNLSEKYSVICKDIANLQEELNTSDIAFVATGAQVPTITSNMLAGRSKPILILDLSLPRNVEPSSDDLENVELIHLDELSQIANQVLADRLTHLPQALDILKEEYAEFVEWQDSRKIVPVLHALNSRLKTYKDNELDKMLKTVDSSQHDNIIAVTDKLVQKITGQIANHLRNESTKPETEIEAIQDIFKLDQLA
ncbi:MAG: glutamyl-tRNA reductase [Euryarchaeota archaeon]|nr:glutamyl-tRNA reductase [Euryarchaeota archaeon]